MLYCLYIILYDIVWIVWFQISIFDRSLLNETIVLCMTLKLILNKQHCKRLQCVNINIVHAITKQVHSVLWKHGCLLCLPQQGSTINWLNYNTQCAGEHDNKGKVIKKWKVFYFLSLLWSLSTTASWWLHQRGMKGPISVMATLSSQVWTSAAWAPSPCVAGSTSTSS